MGIKVKMYNEYEIKEIIKTCKDFNVFYKSDLVVFLEFAQKMIKKLEGVDNN